MSSNAAAPQAAAIETAAIAAPAAAIDVSKLPCKFGQNCKFQGSLPTSCQRDHSRNCCRNGKNCRNKATSCVFYHTCFDATTKKGCSKSAAECTHEHPDPAPMPATAPVAAPVAAPAPVKKIALNTASRAVQQPAEPKRNTKQKFTAKPKQPSLLDGMQEVFDALFKLGGVVEETSEPFEHLKTAFESVKLAVAAQKKIDALAAIEREKTKMKRIADRIAQLGVDAGLQAADDSDDVEDEVDPATHPLPEDDDLVDAVDGTSIADSDIARSDVGGFG
jgi:hypothetical protein